MILHHGAVDGVTGSCHELVIDSDDSVLIDCGLFQGEERSGGGAGASSLEIDFPVDHVRALVVTHVHIDHVGRIPYLFAAGFAGPIYCSQPSEKLLPLVLEDALKIGFTRDQQLVERFLALVGSWLVPLAYGRWQPAELKGRGRLRIRLQPAGHILGSAYVECDVKGAAGEGSRVVFSGDLGAPHAPLLRPPVSPEKADVVVLESTYSDRLHEGRATRKARLKAIIGKALADKGVVLIPAFSIGRTQELLYEIEDIIHGGAGEEVREGMAWEDLEVIVDSPLASRFTEVYRELVPFWDQEAQSRRGQGRHPLSFEQITTIDSHEDHLATVAYLRRTARPCIVIAASGMCAGGRVVNYLKALLGDRRNDVVFVGYQARGTPGWAIQTYGPQGGYVVLEGRRYSIEARVHTLAGYSAHADQQNLVDFIGGIPQPPRKVILVHGDEEAKEALREKIREKGLSTLCLEGKGC